jgi:L-aspartate oxidase
MGLRHSDINSGAGDTVLVCGSGIAGCLVALHGAARSRVTLVTKRTLGSGSTARAQGGIAAAVGADDSVESHLADTLAAGAGLCDEGAARELCAYGPDCVRELVSLGVRFDGGDPPTLGLEGAHSARRIVHVDGDATGAGVMAALRSAVRAHPGIEVVEREQALRVIVEDGVATGLLCEDASGARRVRRARAVVLATGGIGQVFPFTTNPRDATGDGIALAARAGAALADMEMVQFHPTALAVEGSPLPLISEAVRGAGAHLRDARGRRFLDGRDGVTELSPRDQVARAIYRRAREDGRPVTLDLRHLDAATVRARFPGITALCAEHGLDLARDPIPVMPAAHYFMGGVLTDVAGRSTLPGLLAVGECASTGAHGANRLASNSLLEGALMAERAARALTDPIHAWPEGPTGPDRGLPAVGPADTAWREQMRAAMWSGAGLERDRTALLAAGDRVRLLAPAPDVEAANMRDVGRAVLDAALARSESRGAHYRADFPRSDAAQARRVAWVDGRPVELDRANAPTRKAA